MNTLYPYRRPFVLSSSRPFMFGMVMLLLLAILLGERSLATPMIRGASAPILAATPDFGKVPLIFIPNQGQLNKQVDFSVRGSDKSLFFTPQGVTFAFNEPHKAPITGVQENPDPMLTNLSERSPGLDNVHRWIVKLDFIDTNPNVLPQGEEPTSTRISFFKGRADQRHSSIATYGSIRYSNLWNGIDLIYKGTFNELKYEFIIHPGADPRQIRLSYRGASSVVLNTNGQLGVTTPLGKFYDDAPSSYQEIDNDHISVSSSFKMIPTTSNGSVNYSFNIGEYDHTKTLVLDPAIVIYGGFIGGSEYDSGSDIAVDNDGNAYIVGTTLSTEATFPVTVGPDVTSNSRDDAFIAKINALGNALEYIGYIGGDGDDHGNAIAIDASGNAYIAGDTSSSEASFPIVNGPDISYNGGGDAFVAKVNPSGESLIYAGYIGGSSSDRATDISIDASGSAYITGSTFSSETTFPIKIGPDLSFNLLGDAFVAKINPTGSDLSYAGYIGGNDGDIGLGIAVNNQGNAYITGATGSGENTFPVNVGPDLSYNSGIRSSDGFVAEVSISGDKLMYSGYIGGSGDDIATKIALDNTGNAYITGYTRSSAGFPVSIGPDLTYNGSNDAFIAKVNPLGSGLVYAGYIGGAASDQGLSIAVDDQGNAYIAGNTNSSQDTFPIIDSQSAIYNGNDDAFITKVSSSGSVLLYSGYIGGADHDYGAGVAVDRSHNVYVTGQTYSSEASFPESVGPDLTINGSGDAFIVKIGNITEPTAYSVSGRVVAGSSSITNLSGITITAVSISRLITANTVTDQLGSYTLSNLPPDTYTLTPSAANSAMNVLPKEQTVTISNANVSSPDFTAYLILGAGVDYFALGDSIAAGHGLTNNPAQPCRQSDLSYPYLVFGMLKTRYADVSLYHLACSGATTQEPNWNALKKINQYDKRKWLKNQVDETINILSSPSRPKDRQAIVSITIGIDDYPWTSVVEMIKLLKINKDATFRDKVNQIATKSADTTRAQVNRILKLKNTSVIVTEYYNPFNTQSHFFIAKGAYQCGLIGISSCYDRTNYGIDTLNTALKGAVVTPLAAQYPNRIAMTQGINDAFLGRIPGSILHLHESPAPECGKSSPGVETTWIQYPSDKESYSFPGDAVPLLVRNASGISNWRGDCVHPNKYGAMAYARYVDNTLISMKR